ncbi:hypothetical protein [Aeromonas phage SW69-9]|uniref:Major capsid protein n=1 Tax=Aeromonas phage vB_AehM_DM2 TaxID=2973716 RepID=A0AA94YNL9_9CAUD|nr:hypothetical protein [Aeromonas phage L9-6]APU02085.1 hypothetical protein [Aeromonas phage Riv-10]APU02332.1 hypothetical protein [Aeromonas phage SW69-9]UYD59591.1 major capsid protein [Aeromonas phage avDM5]UYD60435.1 major capsid protein [Aeromonas phage avDM2]
MKTFLECSGKSLGKDKQVDEDMVAGDSGGNPTDIAAGKTSGAITSPGPETLGKKKNAKPKV